MWGARDHPESLPLRPDRALGPTKHLCSQKLFKSPFNIISPLCRWINNGPMRPARLVRDRIPSLFLSVLCL